MPFSKKVVRTVKFEPSIPSLALDALDIKVHAKGTNDVQVEWVISLEVALPSTEQTIWCLNRKMIICFMKIVI